MSALMEAEFAVRQLHARYADAVWRQDGAAFADCFAAQAVWEIAGVSLRGREAIGVGFAGFMGGIERTLMTFRTPIVSLGEAGGGEPPEVSARTYVTEQTKYRDGTAAASIGVYHERFAAEDGALRFAWRHWQMAYYGPADLSAPFHPGADCGPPPGMPGDGEPTVGRAWWATSRPS
ncbi:MAG: nuclear transport factor 2 family protein [Novosphingobium sp.]